MVWKSHRLKEKKHERFENIKKKLKSAVRTISDSPSKTEKVKNIHHFFDILINNPDYLYNDTRLNIISLYKLHEFESNGFDKKKYIKAFQSHYLPKKVTGKIDQKTLEICHFLANSR